MSTDVPQVFWSQEEIRAAREMYSATFGEGTGDLVPVSDLEVQMLPLAKVAIRAALRDYKVSHDLGMKSGLRGMLRHAIGVAESLERLRSI